MTKNDNAVDLNICNRVRKFSEDLTLDFLNLTDCDMNVFPQCAIDLLADCGERVVRLDISRNNLHDLPSSLFKVVPNLRILFASSNNFSSLPESLKMCTSLFMLAFRSNGMTGILDVHNLPSSIGWLILTDNNITSIPNDFGQLLPNIRKLMLSNNQLSSLPSNMMDDGLGDNLELIRLANNKFETVPECLFKGHKLAWLGLGGNPCSKSSLNSLRDLDQDLRLSLDDYVLQTSPKLGKGASGDVYLAREKNDEDRKNEGQNNNVKIDINDSDSCAIKIYKGELTSDGNVLDEVETAICLRWISGLIPMRGFFGQDDGTGAGIVMDLVRGMKELGAPPSFESVTRDVYPSEGRFKMLHSTVNILRQIANVAEQMHHLKHAHGDLYGHNILYNPHPPHPCYLTDLGAAYCYKDERLEFIEVRAFGNLIEELVNATPEREKDDHLRTWLLDLSERCLDGVLTERPRFSDIVARLHEEFESR